MTNPIFNRALLKIHRDNTSDKIKQHDFLLALSSHQLFEHATALRPSYNNIIDLGARSGLMTQKLIEQYPSSHIIITDMSEEMLKANPAKHQLLLDEENIPSGLTGFDLITSLLNAHWINDLPQFFKNIKKMLNPDGVLVLSLFGSPTLKNLRSLLLASEIETGSIHSPHISPFVSASDLYKILQYAGFSFIIVENDTIEVEYDNPIALMRELKNMGESNNLFTAHPIMPKKLRSKLLSTQEPFTDSFEIITLVAS